MFTKKHAMKCYLLGILSLSVSSIAFAKQDYPTLNNVSAKNFLAVSSGQTIPVSSLSSTIQKVKQSVVGIGIFTPLKSRSAELRGTGFVFGDGQYVATNYHVVSDTLDPTIVQYYTALAGSGKNPTVVKAEIVGISPQHDLAILKLDKKLTPISLAADEFILEGTDIAFTGFPIGAVIGLYPATHKGMVSAITPDVLPVRNSKSLNHKKFGRLDNPMMIYQLDAIAYPGNSGSPVYDQYTGSIVGIINKVFVTAGKESAITTPSGISYAIPVKYLRALAKKHGIEV